MKILNGMGYGMYGSLWGFLFNFLIILLIIGVGFLLLNRSGYAHTSPGENERLVKMEKDIEDIKKTVEEIKSKLEEI